MTTPVNRDRPLRVLLIDDDPDDHVLTRTTLAEIKTHRFQLDWVKEFNEGLARVCSGEYDIVLLDYRLGERTGLDMLREMAAQKCDAPAILLTGQSDHEIDLAVMQAGAADYLEKERLDAILLERSIRYALQQKQSSLLLEAKVRERTREIELANEALQQEIQERRRAEEALKEADRRKDEFLATLAHELRNPLAPIRNALEIMRISATKPEVVERARQLMERQVNQMVRLITDLLDVSRITRKKLQLQLEKLQLKDVIESAVEVATPAMEAGGLTLRTDLPDEPIWIEGDRLRVAQVFSNLLNNAAKYTERGGTVDVWVKRDDASVRVHVKDTGVGIPEEMLPKIFELFTQVDRSLNRSQGGLGIGLALVKRLVDMHHGEVGVRSEGPNRGAEFFVHLPTLKPEEIPIEAGS
jgi:signal transduction histidine kinase